MLIRVKKVFSRYKIKQELLSYFRLNLNVEKVATWNSYLKTIGVNHDFWYVVRYIINNLSVSKSGNSYSIEVNRNLQLDGKYLSDLAGLIDQGNLEIKGTNLFTDGFRYLRDGVN